MNVNDVSVFFTLENQLPFQMRKCSCLKNKCRYRLLHFVLAEVAVVRFPFNFVTIHVEKIITFCGITKCRGVNLQWTNIPLRKNN